MALFGRGGIVTAGMVASARRDVWRELLAAGLATGELSRVRVTRPWIQLGNRVGFYLYDVQGTIAVPALSVGRWREYTREAPWTGVRDVLRHEYGHALADRHPELVECAEFRARFGGEHDDALPVASYAHATHATEYAASCPSEDFAETVMLYLRVGGRIEGFRSRRGLHGKLAFVAGLSTRLRGRGAELTADPARRYRSAG